MALFCISGSVFFETLCDIIVISSDDFYIITINKINA